MKPVSALILSSRSIELERSPQCACVTDLLPPFRIFPVALKFPSIYIYIHIGVVQKKFWFFCSDPQKFVVNWKKNILFFWNQIQKIKKKPSTDSNFHLNFHFHLHILFHWFLYSLIFSFSFHHFHWLEMSKSGNEIKSEN